MKRLLLLMPLLLAGCERPEYHTVTIVKVHTRAMYDAQSEWTRVVPHAYVKADDGRIFFVRGDIGSVGDTLSIDVHGNSVFEVGK